MKVDPQNTNRQITFLKGDKKLVFVVTSRGTETPKKNEFIATEVCQQIFQGETQIYLNEVETTTNYHWLEKENQIEADQITAIYHLKILIILKPVIIRSRYIVII